MSVEEPQPVPLPRYSTLSDSQTTKKQLDELRKYDEKQFRSQSHELGNTAMPIHPLSQDFDPHSVQGTSSDYSNPNRIYPQLPEPKEPVPRRSTRLTQATGSQPSEVFLTGPVGTFKAATKREREILKKKEEREKRDKKEKEAQIKKEKQEKIPIEKQMKFRSETQRFLSQTDSSSD